MCSKTQCALRVSGHLRRDAPQSRAADDDRLARFDVAHELRPDMVQRAALRGDDPPALLDASDAERTHAERVADADQRVLRADREGVRALERTHEVGRLLLPGVAGCPCQQVCDDLRVRTGRAGDSPVVQQTLAQLLSIDDIAVVRERQLDAWALGDDGLRVQRAAGAGGGVARVPDRDVPGQPLEVLLPEDVGDEPLVGEIAERPPVRRGDAGALLPPVLQREQAVEGDLCGFVVGRSGKVCANDPARFAGSVGLNDRQPAAYCQESLAQGVRTGNWMLTPDDRNRQTGIARVFGRLLVPRCPQTCQHLGGWAH